MGEERHPNQPYARYLHRCILWTDTDRAHCMATSNTTHSIGGVAYRLQLRGFLVPG